MQASSILLACGVLFGALIAPGPARPADATLAHMFAKGGLPDEAANRFAESIRTIRPVTVVGEARLGDEVANLRQLSEGEIAFAITGDLLVSRAMPRLALANFPFLHKTGETARNAYDSWLGAEIRKALKAVDVDLLAVYCVGRRYLTSRRPVNGVANLAGLSLRLPPDPVSTLAWSQLGAQVVNIPFPRLPAALATGFVEAQENPLNFIRSEGLYEHQGWLIDTGHYHQHQFILASTRFIATFDATDRAAIREAARATARTVCAQALEEESAALAWLTDEGGMTLLPFERPPARAAALTAIADLDPAPGEALRRAFGLVR